VGSQGKVRERECVYVWERERNRNREREREKESKKPSGAPRLCGGSRKGARERVCGCDREIDSKRQAERES
jgi:hypothetical protein